MVEASVPDPKSPSTDELLRALLLNLSGQVRREQFETWFRSLNIARIDDQEVELSVTSQFVRDWLSKNYMGILQASVAHTLGPVSQGPRRLVLTHRDEDGWDSLRLIQASPIDAELQRVVQLRSAGAGSSSAPLPATPAAPTVGTRRPGTQLNPNYTFDKFVVGTCNRLAHASALAIGENPGCAYNPLFLHGNVGLGKSHLLQAVCHTVVKRNPQARVVYLSCEDFTNAFIQAIQSGEIDAFRAYYRNADMLVIDDVQFLANKEKTQDEFFHTFNALYDAQKQIVLSSDRPPIEIPTIEERLVSRFKWGLVTEVEAPCFDTRAAIVRRKAMVRGIELPNDVAEFIAQRVTTNIRELEGAVLKIIGMHAITEQPITMALAESCVRDMPIHHAQVGFDDVMQLITTEFAISARELVGKGRTQAVSFPRQIAMFLLREHTENSLEDIGRNFGGRDHTTVIYAVQKIKERRETDRMFKELLDGLSNRLLTRSFRSGQ